MCVKISRDRIRNENLCRMVGVAPMKEGEMKEDRLRWFRHDCRSVDVVFKSGDGRWYLAALSLR